MMPTSSARRLRTTTTTASWRSRARPTWRRALRLQGTARKWATKWIKVLEDLAVEESEEIQKLMTASAANPRKLFQGDVRLSAIIA